MNSIGQNEAKEIERLQSLVIKMQQSKEVVLNLVYPAKERRNDSGKITIVGGSYNPFHICHRELILRTLEYVDGTEAIAYITLSHSLGKPLTGADYAQRLYMLKMEQDRAPFMSVGVINDGFYRNWFHRLREFHPEEDNKYICVMGADLFPRAIEGNSEEDYPTVFSIDWLVAGRSGKRWQDFKIPDSARKYLSRVSHVALPEDIKDVSSTGLKEMINQRDGKVLEFLAKEHFDFIKRHNIYF